MERDARTDLAKRTNKKTKEKARQKCSSKLLWAGSSVCADSMYGRLLLFWHYLPGILRFWPNSRHCTLTFVVILFWINARLFDILRPSSINMTTIINLHLHCHTMYPPSFLFHTTSTNNILSWPLATKLSCNGYHWPNRYNIPKKEICYGLFEFGCGGPVRRQLVMELAKRHYTSEFFFGSATRSAKITLKD